MKISIKATNLKLTDSIYAYIDKKIGELERFIGGVGGQSQLFEKGKPPYEAWVEVGKTMRHHRKGNVFRAEVQMRLPGKNLRAEAENLDLYAAIDEVKEEIEGELRKYKEKQVTIKKRGFKIYAQ